MQRRQRLDADEPDHGGVPGIPAASLRRDGTPPAAVRAPPYGSPITRPQPSTRPASTPAMRSDFHTTTAIVS